jgi:hypothetical protein
MPDFNRAQIATTTADLTSYTEFLRKLKVGQTITVPLESGESTRRVMRNLNSAAAQSKLRLARLPSEENTVRFRVLSPEKRQIAMSDEAKRARVAKAHATKEARRQELAQLGTMGRAEVAVSETAADAASAPNPARTRRRRRSAAPG